MCHDAVHLTSAFCDSSGACRVTGVGRVGDKWEKHVNLAKVKDAEVAYGIVRPKDSILTNFFCW